MLCLRIDASRAAVLSGDKSFFIRSRSVGWVEPSSRRVEPGAEPGSPACSV